MLNINNLNRLIGMDDMINNFMSQFGKEWTDTYPPRNMVKVDDNKYLIELAVAGFKEEELKVATEEDNLTISGTHSGDENQRQYLCPPGIARRNFKLTFKLMDYIKVTGASLENGILSISLERVIPQAKKYKEIKLS